MRVAVAMALLAFIRTVFFTAYMADQFVHCLKSKLIRLLPIWQIRSFTTRVVGRVRPLPLIWQIFLYLVKDIR
jgi:hypothetical protein